MRAGDFDENSEVTPGVFTFIEEGTTNADSGFVLTTDGSITVGTTNLEFSQFSGAGQITAGTGLSKSGNTLDIDSTVVTLTGNQELSNKTFVTPVLGTPSSGNLSNCTALPTSSLTGTITNNQLAGSIANGKLENSSLSLGGVSISLGGTVATPAFDLSSATNYPTGSLSGTITNNQLAGSIANEKLENYSLSLGGVSISLGGTVATPAFDLSSATNYPTGSLSGTITNNQLAGSIDLTSKVTNTLPSSNGGTGHTTFSNGQLLIGNTSNGLSKATLTAGDNITITNGNGSITIASEDTPTYDAATTEAEGLMSSSDKTKLDGIESGADVTDTANVSSGSINGL